MSERNTIIYVTTEQPPRWLRIDVPAGMIPPPTITVGQPMQGTVEFYFAECYRLPIPAEARKAAT